MASTISANEATAESPQMPETGNAFHTLDTRQLIPVIISLMLGMLLAALDQTVVGSAMPRIVTELGGINFTWVVTSYLLASTVTVPIIGKLSDIYGRKLFFIGGMAIFLLGSALCGMSQNMTELVLFRGVQGLGAGAIMPIALSIIGDIFPPAERGKWQGLFTAVFGLASIVGPLLGGTITDHWTWRWVFYVNMPVGAIALAAAIIALPAHSNRTQHRIDYSGAALLIVWSVALLLAFSLGGTELAWNSWQIIGMFVLAVAGLAAFFLVEQRAEEPIILPSLFKNDIFAVSVLSMFLVTGGMFGAITYLAPFVQLVQNQSATNSGVILMPMMLGFIVSSIVGGQLLSRTGRYKVMAMVGAAIAAVGMFLLARMTPATSNVEIVRNMVIAGLGIGSLMSLFTIIVQNAFSRNMIGQVTSSLTFFRSLGSSIGVAVLGAIVTNRFADDVVNTVPTALKPFVDTDKLSNLSTAGEAVNLPAAAAALGPQQLAVLAGQLATNVKDAFASSVTTSFAIGAVMLVVAFAVITIFLREIPLRGRQPAENPASEAAEAEPEPVPEAFL